MRHRKRGRKLGRSHSHRDAMLRNLTISLLEHERVVTTLSKAKECAPFAERMITLAKKGTLAHRRLAVARLHNKAIVRKLFDELADRYVDREGGYTRVLKLNERRLGDAAPRALLELVQESEQRIERKVAPTVVEKEDDQEAVEEGQNTSETEELEEAESTVAAEVAEESEDGDEPSAAEQ